MQNTVDTLFTIEQTAIYLKVSTKTIRRLINQNELIAFKVGRCWRIRQGDIELYLNRNRNGANAPKEEVKS